MNKFIIACLCAFVAVSSAADAPANPLQGILASLQNFKLENICAPACGAVCAAQKFLCVGIPNLNDCVKADKKCNADCKTICDCIAACPKTCEDANKCAAPAKGQEAGFNQFICKSKQDACKAVCQANCPGQLLIGELQKMAMGGVAQIQAIVGQLMPKPAA